MQLDMPGKPTIRAERIHHHHRMLARALDFERTKWFPHPIPGVWTQWRDRSGRPRYLHTWEEVVAYRREHARLRAENRAICSCASCGNPRRWFDEPTRQELLAAISAQEQIREILARVQTEEDSAREA
jgi:hypothetical protein